jgi:hypothetical protein
MIIIMLLVPTVLVIYLFIEFQKEKRRNRILQSFTAGIIKSISDYISQTDMADVTIANDFEKIHSRKFPIPYKEILGNINHEFEKDFWMRPYRTWIINDRNIFHETKYANDGFNMIYWDFFDNAVAEIQKKTDKNKK